MEHTLECIGANPRVQNIGNAVWGGLPLVEVLDALGVEIPASAVDLRLLGVDGYHAGLPVDEILDGPVWLVWRMNGDPLPLQHGAPARLLVPGRYGVKNLKWIEAIDFVDQPHESYWTATKGEHTVGVRCTTASGAGSAGPEGTDPWAGWDGSMQIRIADR